MAVRYDADYAGTGELMRSPEMLVAIIEAAAAGMLYAQSIAPVQSGEYVASFRVEGELRGGPRRDRAEARLINDSPHAAEVEWRNHGGERILGRTVDFIESRSGR